MKPYVLHTGKSEIVLRDYPDNYFDSCVTDSPYGIRFMGKPGMILIYVANMQNVNQNL